jgi:CheY-like chemotaxis protein
MLAIHPQKLCKEQRGMDKGGINVQRWACYLVVIYIRGLHAAPGFLENLYAVPINLAASHRQFEGFGMHTDRSTDSALRHCAPTALLVEDDAAIRCFMRAALEEHGWHVCEAGTLTYANALFHVTTPDLIVLELGLPEGGAVDFIVQVRQQSLVPVIVLAARVEESDKAGALAAGADDYLTKLFGVGERFNAALRRLRPVQKQ